MKDVCFYYRVSYYDVLRDTEDGWIGNYSVHDQQLLGITDPDVSDAKIERAARALYNFTGRRTIREDFGDAVRWVDPKSAVAVEINYAEKIT